MRKLSVVGPSLVLFAGICFAQTQSAPTQPAQATSQPNLGVGSGTQSAPQTQSAPSSMSAPQPAESPTAPPATTAPATTVPQPDSVDKDTQQGPVLGTRPQKPVAPTHIPMARTVPVGAEFTATLDTPLSSKTSQSGQPFTATLTQALRNNHSDVLVPAGAKVHGVVQSVESGKILASLRGKGQITLRFTEVSLADGYTLPLAASLLSVNEGKSGKNNAATNSEGQINGKTSGTAAAKDVGIGAGLGTLAGAIFGGALKGLAIGAIAGGGYVLANAGKDVELPADTGLRIRLDQNLTLPANAVPVQR